MIELQAYSWPEPWESMTNHPSRHAFESELKHEVTNGHPLWGKTATLIAKRYDRDDFLFEIAGPIPQYAQVHLTHSRSPEKDPRWPQTKLFSSLQEWHDRFDSSL